MMHRTTISRTGKFEAMCFVSFRVISRAIAMCFGVLLGATVVAQGARPKPAASAPTYRDIAPILQARCVVCHNKNTVSVPAVSGGLALDSYVALKAGVAGKIGAQPIFIAGKSGQ